jgi:hypothetical protein
MTIHELKILPEYYDAVRCGDKRFEIRKNDRDYHTGDILRLKEWDGKQYTGEELDAVVRYIYHGIDEYGLAEGYCIMSIDTMMHDFPRVTATDNAIAVGAVNGGLVIQKGKNNKHIVNNGTMTMTFGK